ncbi:hypothetical protein ACWKWU_09735 [Chitinophaga lutea]
MDVPTQSADLQIGEWKNEVRTVRQDLHSMRSRLEEMAATRRPGHDGMASVEHFQNQFIRQLEVADEMYHDLKQSAKLMGIGRPAIVHHDRPVDDMDAMRDRMDMFRKLHGELRGEFDRFSTFR